VCDLETSRIGAQYIYDISNLRVKRKPHLIKNTIFERVNTKKLKTQHKTEENTHRTGKTIRYTHTTGTVVTITQKPKVRCVMGRAEDDLRRSKHVD
jgi:hypothetical protein